MKSGFFADNVVTHFTASFLAVSLILCYSMFCSHYLSCLLFCVVCELLVIIKLIVRGGSRKKYLGGLAPHHLGGNNEQNYCVQLSSIKQLMYRNYPENFGGLGKI